MEADEGGVAPGWKTTAARRGAVHIAEVAALAGVSTATVSRSLTMPGRVSPATRERVLEVVRRTGYTPNVAGRNLRAARSGMVLVVVPSLITPFFADLLLGVDRALSARGYGLLVGNLHDGEGKEERLLDLLLAGQADGALLLNGHVLRGATRSLADTAIPMVAVSVPTAAADVPAVLVQDREGGAAAAGTCWSWATGASATSPARPATTARTSAGPGIATPWRPPA
jgi:LacI family repressor for deo operon, udp, cdd, tsx, nupC, and nupG